jgi:hypothetical protein
MLYKIFAQCLLLCFIIIFCGPVLADNKGQIININQNYQIAFTDLGNSVLKQGDIVKVTLNADEFVYMQVLESSPILSKLGTSQSDNFRTSLKDFQGMAVGNEVVKVDQTHDKAEHPATAIPDSADAAALLEQKIQKLEGQLALAKTEIKRLEELNQESKAKLNDLTVQAQTKNDAPAVVQQADNNEVLSQLKAHLDNMHKLIDENN